MSTCTHQTGYSSCLTLEALTLKASADIACIRTHDWSIDGSVAYVFDILTLTGELGYGSEELLSASVVASSDALIDGATLEYGWDGAADLLNKNDAKANYGKIYTGLTLSSNC